MRVWAHEDFFFTQTRKYYSATLHPRYGFASLKTPAVSHAKDSMKHASLCIIRQAKTRAVEREVQAAPPPERGIPLPPTPQLWPAPHDMTLLKSCTSPLASEARRPLNPRTTTSLALYHIPKTSRHDGTGITQDKNTHECERRRTRARPRPRRYN